MHVHFDDGRCRSCSGQLAIAETDDATMAVECAKCGEAYLVEPDAFGDDGIKYWSAAFLTSTEDDCDE